MEYKLKPISKAGIAEATAKVELYRYLNEPEEAESICRDILAVEPQHQLALRLLGLSITDQFVGGGDMLARAGNRQAVRTPSIARRGRARVDPRSGPGRF